MKEKEKGKVHLVIDNIVIDLITDYHDLTHSQVVTYYRELISQSIESPGNIANETKCPKLLFRKKGQPIYKTVKLDEATIIAHQNYVYNPFASPDNVPHNFVWVVRGYYPGSKIPFKLSVVQHREFEPHDYFCKVVLGDKTKATRFNDEQINSYQEEVAEATLLDKDFKSLEQIPYNRKTFKCMRPKGIPLLKKSK